MCSILTYVLFLLAIRSAMCQVCNETRSIFREVPESYRFTFIESYEEPCVMGIFCSVKTRQSVNVTTRLVQRYELVTVNVCCDGYVEDENHEGNGIYCKPVCNPPCQNGYCRKPNQCACEAGYALDPLNPHICKPLCLKDCEIPDCISTKPPQCTSNNKSVTIANNPAVCNEACVNGNCVGPDICQCFSGYHKSSAYNCEPINYFTNNQCEHGTAIDNNTCLCDQGWEWTCGSCRPICHNCNYGTCVLPGQCECSNGYSMIKGQCEPYCSNGCANGRCVNPEFCSCNTGWYKTKTGECKPHCDVNCEHGECIAPNVCECDIGYQLYINADIYRCLPNSKDCEDSTSDPITCKCDPPYEIRYFTDSGSDCNCIGACLNSSTICTKAMCLYMDLAFDMFPPGVLDDYGIGEIVENPVLFPTAIENSENSTLHVTEIDENTEETDTRITPPVLDYDYDSDEDDNTFKVYGIPGATEAPDVTSTSFAIEINKFTENLQTNSTSDADDIKGDDPTTEIKVVSDLEHDEMTTAACTDTTQSNKPEDIPNLNDTLITKNYTPSFNKNASKENTNLDKPNMNSESHSVNRESNLSVYWMIAAATVAAFILLFIIWLAMKCVCFRRQTMSTSGNHEDAVMYYTKQC